MEGKKFLSPFADREARLLDLAEIIDMFDKRSRKKC